MATDQEIKLARMKDIDGLDGVSWWPLAPGWWLLIILVVVAITYKIYKYFKKRAWLLSWQGNTCVQLTKLENELTEENAQVTAIELSKLIKRIAMHQHSRPECAALFGSKWLEWLAKKYPEFDWKSRGRILQEHIYAPKDTKIDLSELKDLINATKSWIS